MLSPHHGSGAGWPVAAPAQRGPAADPGGHADDFLPAPPADRRDADPFANVRVDDVWKAASSFLCY